MNNNNNTSLVTINHRQTNAIYLEDYDCPAHRTKSPIVGINGKPLNIEREETVIPIHMVKKVHDIVGTQPGIESVSLSNICEDCPLNGERESCKERILDNI